MDPNANGSSFEWSSPHILARATALNAIRLIMYYGNALYMIVLALDTSEARGSISILQDVVVLETVVHTSSDPYSNWLLPAVDNALRTAGKTFRDIDLFAVAPGPGSFTGVRIGLTTVKAWSEVFGRPIAAVSRLEALADQAEGGPAQVASFIDAQKGQVFGALYKRGENGVELFGEEMVAAAEDFVLWVKDQIGSGNVLWVSTDPSVVESVPAWQSQFAKGNEILSVPCVLAPLIGKLGFQKALKGNVLDAISLDANYVRRSYAEVAWKGSSDAARK